MGSRPFAARTLRRCAALALVGGLVVVGCLEGRAPTEVIPSGGGPRTFLPPPPDGVVPGTTYERGILYNFDRTLYRLFAPIGGTDPQFIRRDSVLALASAGNPGADEQLLLRPDLSDPTLAQVYANPRLFGFVASDAAQVGFVDGPTAQDPTRYFPTTVGNRWTMNYEERLWSVNDSIVPVSISPPTAVGFGSTFQLVSTSEVTDSRFTGQFYPHPYSANIVGSNIQGQGIYYHAWTLIAERIVLPRLRTSVAFQSNPRFLWLSLQSLDQTRDPQAAPPITTDQCLDGLESNLELFPVKICGDPMQVGDIYSTWTYITVDQADLIARVAAEGDSARGGRCGKPVGVGTDTLRMFPTNSFRLLCKFESRCERIVDQVTVTAGPQVIGQYPVTPSPGAVVQFRVTMKIATIGGQEIDAQFLELWYLRDIGQVVQRMGVFPQTRSDARLLSCHVDGLDYDRTNNWRGVFFYADPGGLAKTGRAQRHHGGSRRF